MTDQVPLQLKVNGTTHRVFVEPRKLLSDVLREELNLTGTHIGCEHGACGACTVLVDGAAVRSCLLFAVQVNDAEVTTVEGVTPGDGTLNNFQQAMQDQHGLQCGFCTPGIVVSMCAFLKDNANPTDDDLKIALSGNLCRCTGYRGIINAARQAAGLPIPTTAAGGLH
jgi:aerobic carbon-monoxide dehydrogenase small subunit